jgi:cytochrome c oxidase assembly factor CtaG
MFKMFLAFVAIAVMVGSCISMFRSLSGKEKWNLTKIVSYAIMCSAIAVGILTAIVVLF